MLVSAAVMDLISGRIDAPTKELGTLKLRNISRPVHAYTVGTGKRRKSAPVIDSFQRSRPSIAVLPFVDQADETANSYFSDGLVEDIVSALSCLPELIVISRTSTLRYRGVTPDPRQIRRELHVRYMLSGSVRRSGSKVRLSAELADCESGTTIWSDSFAGETNDLFQMQDELSAGAPAPSAAQLQEAELRPALRKRPESLDAYEYTLRGLHLFYNFEDDKFLQALPMFERAMALDPTYPTAPALAANWYSVRINQGMSPDRRADYDQVERLSRLALTLDRFDPRALSLCGHVRALLFRDFDHAIELYDRALAANPSSSIAWLRSSPPSATSARHARRAGAPISACACRPTMPTYSSAIRWSRCRPTLPATMPRRPNGRAARQRSTRATRPTCASLSPASRPTARSRRLARSAPTCCVSMKSSGPCPSLKPTPSRIPASVSSSANISCSPACTSDHFPSASLMRSSSIARIGASAGSMAKSVFQRWAAAFLSPAAKDAAPR